MEQIVNLHIEKLAEGVYLATSDDVQGLVAQGRTVAETLEIARDVARKIFEIQAEHGQPLTVRPYQRRIRLPIDFGCLLGRLNGFRYRDIAAKLRRLGFVVNRQAAGSHEIWRNAATGRLTTLANHPGHLHEGTLRPF